ncbi:MAG: Rpn family recombination-promoting nuclease/putative transposase [Candidatus Pseudobacter hemicellulosilyticus]|uniref:Rpn family recombination-promoting nuclease/putative transposase n=1 Tax=Candidatus Pseudobacter hemicellulosilyticus TaxID=3121375 RepID=A0AAJ5WXE9_9BACT|nr:MAG: Rpn family recombination-promoting nuclease/putative transposase [Pseudobacter sp.]
MAEEKVYRFIDPLTDYGFKKLFGNKDHCELLVDLLNALIRPEFLIIDIFFRNTELLSPSKYGRRIIFDIYATDSEGNTFIVEMQRVKEKHFKDRSLFYASGSIGEQEKKGEWEFGLTKTYMLCFMDFCFEDTLPEKAVHEVKLLDAHTGQLFTDKLMFWYIELPKCKKAFNELASRADKWLYLLVNLGRMTGIPAVFETDSIFKQLFMNAATPNMTRKEYVDYLINRKGEGVYNSVMATAREDGMEEGLERGIQKGTTDTLVKIARQMKITNEPLEKIAALTGLTAAEITGL